MKLYHWQVILMQKVSGIYSNEHISVVRCWLNAKTLDLTPAISETKASIVKIHQQAMLNKFHTNEELAGFNRKKET